MRFTNIMKHGKLFNKYVTLRCPICRCEYTEQINDNDNCRVIASEFGALKFESKCPECGFVFHDLISEENIREIYDFSNK